MVYAGEFAAILNVSKPTLKNWMLLGYLNEIRKEMAPKGMQFHIFDIFKYAHPNASNDAIERMIFDYRIAKGKASKMARSKAKKLRNKKTRG